MNKLVESIIQPILEADTKIKKVVGIFGGRFQPFGPHHKKVYEWLSSQFDDAYITTSNIKKLPRHPMNFKEKVRHMTKMGIPSSKIIMEKSPFVAKNLEKKFNSETTAFVYIFGKKDTGRLGGGKYFQDYKKNKKNLEGYKEHGYYLVAPHMSVSAGGLEVSGTAMRELLGSEKYKENREKLFKKMFGYYDKGVFNMMTNKFSKIFENDVIIVPWDNTKEKPKNPKLFDKKKKELLQDFDLELVNGYPADNDEWARWLTARTKWLIKSRKQKKGSPYHIAGKNGVNEVSVKNALKKLKIPMKLTTNKQKLVNYLTSNPQVLTQFLRLIGEEQVNEGKKEFVIWGIAPGKSSEEILYTKAKSSSEAKKIIKILMSKHGVKKARVQVLDLTQDPSKFWKSDNMFEGVDLPIEIGDTVRMGKFKNKKVVIKTIDWNEKGDLLINGKPALKFRIEKSKEID